MMSRTVASLWPLAVAGARLQSPTCSSSCMSVSGGESQKSLFLQHSADVCVRGHRSGCSVWSWREVRSPWHLAKGSVQEWLFFSLSVVLLIVQIFRLPLMCFDNAGMSYRIVSYHNHVTATWL